MLRRDTQEEEPKVEEDVRSVSADGQACTIYSPNVIFQEVWERVQESGLPFVVDGVVHEWSRITISDGDTTLVLSGLKRVGPGDRLSKILLGTINSFERIASAPADRKRLIAVAVAKCQMIVGVRGRPMFTDAHMDLIFDIAGACEGLIFNGSGMIDPEGRLILNYEGLFDPL